MNKSLLILGVAFTISAKAQIGFISTIAGNGTSGFSGNGGSAISATLASPAAVSVDGAGNVYIVDSGNNSIRKVSTNGVISNFAGNGSCGSSYCGDGGAATNAALSNPFGIAIDASGNLYIGDYGNSAVRKVSTNGIITTFAGNGGSGNSGDGGPATNATLTEPAGLATDNNGNLYIADVFNNVIRKVNSLGIISTVAGNGTNGYSGDGSAATAAKLSQPAFAMADAIGNIYIADANNNVIRKVNTNGIISTVAGNGNAFYSGDGGPAISASLDTPSGVAFDASGNLYIVDDLNHRVRKVNSSGIISTYAGAGIPGYTGDGGPALNADFSFPWGITISTAGNIYIADQGNNVIRKINGSTLSINQIDNINNQITIYPNPTSTNFVIETSSIDKQTLQMFDVNGKLVLTQGISGKINIDASHLSEGVYNLSLQNANCVINKRLVIVR